MSFGFSVGDFIALLHLAQKIRKDFVGAPSQFQEISNEWVRHPRQPKSYD